MTSASGAPDRLLVGVRYLLLAGAMIAVVGVAGHFLAWPLLTSALGPTAYVFAAHPASEAARLRNAALGHGVAVAVALFSLAVFGLWSARSLPQRGHATLNQVGAAALAVGLTVLLLEVLSAHHAPAASTALLIATGISRPGTPLYGLLIGLGMLLLIGPLAGRLPLAREQAARHPS